MTAHVSQGCRVFRTLMRLIRSYPDRALSTPTVLGVDDWAIHKWFTCGSILVDLARHRPVDLLSDCSSGSLAAWLRAHPGAEVIDRDRANAYAEGARDGASGAIQFADRCHLVDNLADALESCFRAKRAPSKLRRPGATGAAQLPLFALEEVGA